VKREETASMEVVPTPQLEAFDEKLRRLREAIIAGIESGPADDSSLEGLLAELDAEVAAK
jgi:hypothetical protein